MLPVYTNGKGIKNPRKKRFSKLSIYFCLVITMMVLSNVYFFSKTTLFSNDDETVNFPTEEVFPRDMIDQSWKFAEKKQEIEIIENENFLEEEEDDDFPQTTVNRERRKAIRDAFLHAWNGYERNAWGFDELKPISGSGRNWVEGGIGMNIIDMLDTAYIMGLDKVVQKCLNWIKTKLDFDKNSDISVFETNIRIVGGLLSAYDLIGEEFLLEKATDIADRLLPAFNTRYGLPYSQVNLRTGHASQQSWTKDALLAEFGTMQIEFRRLSFLTGDPKYDKAVTKVMDHMESLSRSDGQYASFFNIQNGKPVGNLIKWGAWGDSFYEYLIKQHLLTSKTEDRYRKMYDAAVNGMHNKLIKKNKEGFTYLIEVDNGRENNKMDHLVCFVVGMLVIGAEGERREKDLEIAKELGKTCYYSYERMASGLSPDYWKFNDHNSFIADSAGYLLRPETVEGMFYLFRATRDQKYRDWGWNIFQAIQKNCKTKHGYSSVRNVKSKNPTKFDEMHTFFVGETLKYLYLLFADSDGCDNIVENTCPGDLIPLNEFVFNTEAHPLRIYNP